MTSHFRGHSQSPKRGLRAIFVLNLFDKKIKISNWYLIVIIIKITLFLSRSTAVFNPFSKYCCVAGPFKVNGCPLRRVSQRYVIATSLKLDISKVEVPIRVTDQYFKRLRQKRAKKEEGDIFNVKKEVRYSSQCDLFIIKSSKRGGRHYKNDDAIFFLLLFKGLIGKANFFHVGRIKPKTNNDGITK